MRLNRLFSTKSKTPILYSIDIRDTAIYLLALERSAERYTITKAERLPLPEGVVVDLNIQTPKVLVNALKQLREKIGGKIEAVALAVPAAAAIIKIISLEEGLTELEIEQHLAYQLPHYLNVTSEAVYFDYEHFFSRTSPSSSIRFVAVRREEINERVALFQAAGWQVTAVDTESLAIERATRWLAAPQEKFQMIGVILFTLNTAALYVIQQGYLVFSRTEHYNPEEDLYAVLQRLWQWLALTEPNVQLNTLFLSGNMVAIKKLITETTIGFPMHREKHFINMQAVAPFLNCEVSAEVDKTLLTTYATEYFVSYGLAMRRWES